MSWYAPWTWGGGGQKDPTSFTAAGGDYNPGETMAYESVDKSQDSQTQAQRSLQNYGMKHGKEMYESGVQAVDKSKDDFAPAMDFFRKLLSGDTGELQQAVGPEADAIHQQFSQIRDMFANTGGRGGGRTSMLAQMPTQEAGQVAGLISRARSNAADKAGSLALGEQGAALQEAGQGQSQLAQIMQFLLGIRNMDKQVDMSNRSLLTQGLSGVASEPLSDASGIGLAKILL